MPSTYNNALRIEEIANGEQSGAWGTTTNKNLGQLIVQAVTGTTNLNVTAGDVTLTALDGLVDEARSAVLAVTGTPGVTRVLTIPNVTKLYTVRNATANIVQVKTASGTAFNCPALSQSYIVCDGANVITGRSITDGANTITATAAPFTSPAFLGVPTAPTAAPGTNTTQLATTAFVTAAVPATVVSSVTGTAPVVSTGGTTPVISMAAATTSVNGYLTSTDWNTFNNKTSNTGTVTSVGASVPAFLSVSGSPVTTSGTLAINYSGTALPIANGGTGATSAGAALTSLGAYPASNPNGYTSNTGTVTSVAATAGTGISVSGSPITTSGTLTITNTAPDQTVSLTAGTGISTTGTYPNFTITNTAPSSGGTVTSVAASVPAFLSVSGSPVTTSGTLAISYSGTALPVANGGTGVTTSTGSGANVLGTSPTIADLTISGAGGNVFSSTYTPTLTNVTNINSSSAGVCYFTRVGNVVTVSGQITINSNVGGNSQLRMTCPVASNFSSVNQAAGTFNNMNYDTTNGGIYASSGSQLEWRFQDQTGGTRIYSFNAAYLVV